jgi:hypothetical protein
MNRTEQDDWHRLFSAALNHRLSEVDQEQLTTLLATSAEARQLWFVYHDNECGLSEQRAAIALPSVRSKRNSVFRRRPLATAAACFALGMFFASAVFAYFVPREQRGRSLLQESFESGIVPGVAGMPQTAAVWSGDYAELSAGQQGVNPATGKQMLRFLRGDFAGRSIPDSFSSDVFYLVDVRPYRAEFADGSAVVQLTALFNAAARQTDDPAHCALTIFALDAESATDPGLVLSRDSLAYSRSSRVWLDDDLRSWQRVSNELRVPPDAEFLMIRIGVSYNPKHQGSREGRFSGHFADEVNLILAHRPEIKLP